MSENLNLVRSIYAAWERGDFSSTAWADPDIEFALIDGPDPASWRGVAGMVEGWRRLRSPWEEYGFEVEELRELDAESVLVLIRLGGRGKTSGVELRQMAAVGANLLQIRGGKVNRLVLYFDRDNAFADLGLEE